MKRISLYFLLLFRLNRIFICVFVSLTSGTFANCEKETANACWLQDGDPSQNSKVAREAWEQLGCEMFAIPPRSPDLNPIENLFHMVRRQLKDDALERRIHKESYKDFVKCVIETITGTSKDYISNTIASMPVRLRAVIQQKGGRTKY